MFYCDRSSEVPPVCVIPATIEGPCRKIGAADDPPPKVQNSGCWKGGRQRWTGGESLGIKLQYAIARKATKTLRPFSPKQGGHTQRKRWLWKHLAIVEMFLYTQSRRLSFALFRLSRKAVSKTSRGGAIYIANYDC